MPPNQALSKSGGEVDRTRRFQKIPHQLPYRPGMQSGAELWQLNAEVLGLFFDGPNGELYVLGEDLLGRQWNASCATLLQSQNGRNSST